MARFNATVTALLLVAGINVAMSITVQEFFPDAKNNLTKIKWSHATNSQDKLNAALKSADVHMIEADVNMGTLVGHPSNTTIPVMAHGPGVNITSDLSLEQFVTQVLASKKKGMKLDFKTIEAFTKSVEILKKANLTVPVWLNADILKGPIDAATEPVDPKAFLAAAHELPKTLLSIGWTTRIENVPAQNVTNGTYTTQQINDMVKTLQESKSNQSVTYPVRACYAANDVPTLQKLLTDTKANNPTLTIWSSEGDKVDAEKLSKLIKTVGVDKVYVDVPQDLWQKLKLTSAAFAAQSSLFVLLASMFALFSVKLL